MAIEKMPVVGLMFEDLTTIVEIKDILSRVQQGESIPFVSSECFDILEKLISHKNSVEQGTLIFPTLRNEKRYQPAISSPRDGSVFKIREVLPYGNSKQTIKAYWGQCNGQLALICQKEPGLVFNAFCYEWKPL